MINNNVQFNGTSFLQSRYVSGYGIGEILNKHGGFTHTKLAGNATLPYIVITDSRRNPKAAQIDADLRKLAEDSAARRGVPLKDVYYYSPRANLSKRWEKNLKKRLTLDA